jgi:predicted RNase H-like HicB family nuclease
MNAKKIFLNIFNWEKIKIMKQFKQLTCIIERAEDSYVSLCPQIDIASQGNSVEEARKNLVEAIELFLEMASPNEILARVYSEIYVTQIEVTIG